MMAVKYFSCVYQIFCQTQTVIFLVSCFCNFDIFFLYFDSAELCCLDAAVTVGSIWFILTFIVWSWILDLVYLVEADILDKSELIRVAVDITLQSWIRNIWVNVSSINISVSLPHKFSFRHLFSRITSKVLCPLAPLITAGLLALLLLFLLSFYCFLWRVIVRIVLSWSCHHPAITSSLFPLHLKILKIIFSFFILFVQVRIDPPDIS